MSISIDLRFHLYGIDEPDTAQEKLETVSGKHNGIRGHQFENELIALNSSDIYYIQDYLSKYKTLGLLVQESNITRKYK